MVNQSYGKAMLILLYNGQAGNISLLFMNRDKKRHLKCSKNRDKKTAIWILGLSHDYEATHRYVPYIQGRQLFIVSIHYHSRL